MVGGVGGARHECFERNMRTCFVWGRDKRGGVEVGRKKTVFLLDIASADRSLASDGTGAAAAAACLHMCALSRVAFYAHIKSYIFILY
jgi:hypothetical protein